VSEMGRIAEIYQWLLKYWNALLAGISLLGVAVFSVIPQPESYVHLFLFLAANAVVWTVIEMKVKLEESVTSNQQRVYPTMRAARADITLEIRTHLAKSRRGQPLTLTLVGGRMRSMGDTVRELADGMAHGEIRGHLIINAFCISPEYLSRRILAGDMDPTEQASRNVGIGHLVQSVRSELQSLSKAYGPHTSISVSVTYYTEDPFCYAYLIGDEMLYWGPFTWDKTASDLLGPENPCIAVPSNDSSFPALREWILSRTALIEAAAAQIL
jgi:hypothetical protein